MSKTLSTHVLDATTGNPAAGIRVELRDRGRRLRHHCGDRLRRPHPRTCSRWPDRRSLHLTFDTGTYFETNGQENFYPEVTVTFRVDDTARGYHVPLLLSPFAYSTYRGS